MRQWAVESPKMQNAKQPSLQEILTSLMNEVVWGRAHLKIAKAIRTADPAIIHTAQTFFGLTHDAHLFAAQMYAAKLHDKTKGPITIRSALAEAERVAGTFAHASAEQVRKTLAAAQAELARFERVLTAIEERRNEYLAHIDARSIVGPTALDSTAALTIDELDDLFVETGNILNDIKQLHDGTLAVLELVDSADYTNAFRLIAEAKCAQAEKFEREFKEPWPYERPAICRKEG
jgi:hypothetical protein